MSSRTNGQVPSASPLQTLPPQAQSTFNRRDWASVGLLIWGVGAGVMLIRSLCDLIAVRQLATGPECQDTELRSLLAKLLTHVGLPPGMRIVLNNQLVSPAICGLWRPVLLWPASLVGSLTPEESAAIIAHELAHVLRHDQWTLALQVIVEALLFFNPAVWWIGRHIRQEREACCDAFAAGLVGSPVEYARVLASHAERLPTIQSLPGVVSAFAGHSSGSLLDRVRRLLLPGYRPTLRVSWGQCAVLLAVTLALLYGVHKTADLSIAYAREILTDQERVEQITQRATALAIPTAANPTFDKVRITGKITIDPSVEPAETIHVHTDIQVTENMSEGGSQNPVQGDTFDFTVRSGLSIILAFSHPHAATTFLGPFGPQDWPLIENQQVRIVPGESRTIRVLDAEGYPAAGLQVQVYASRDGRNGFGLGKRVVTDALGAAVVPHLRPENNYTLSFSGPGFQKQNSSQPFHPFGDAPLEFRVQRSRPARGTVLTEAGDPIAGVTVREFYSFQGESKRGTRGFDDPLATTDADGRFELTTLQDGREYALLLEHPDYARRVISHIAAGTIGHRVTMSPGITVQGRVERHSPDGTFPSEVEWSEQLAVEDPLQRPLHGTTATEEVPVDAEGRFLIPHANPGEISINYCHFDRQFTVSEAQHEIVLDPQLAVTVPPVPRRELVVRFAHNGQPVQPSGKLRLTGQFPREATHASSHPHLPAVVIENGVARFDLPVPAKSLNAVPDELIGFWFSSHQDNLKDLEPGTTPVDAVIDVFPAGAATGRALNVDGTPATNANVSVSYKFQFRSPTGGQSTYSGGVNAHTDIEGRYFLSPIPLGAKCTLSATLGHYRQSEGEIAISAQHPIATRDVQLGSTADVEGVVVDPNGEPLGSIPLSLNFSQPGSSQLWGPPIPTTADGRFRFERLNPRGQYFVDIDSRKQWQPRRVDLSFDTRNRVTLQPGIVIEGRVLDEAGQPVPGVEVYAVVPDGISSINGRIRFESEAPTNMQGEFRFSNLPASELKFAANEVRLEEVRRNTTTTQELTLQGAVQDRHRRTLDRKR